MQTESSCPQVSLPPSTRTVTASREDGATVTFHSALLPPTRCALRTAPLVAVTPSSRSVRKPADTGSLNTSRRVKVVSGPSCSAGTCSKAVVSAGRSVVARAEPDQSPEPPFLTARTR